MIHSHHNLPSKNAAQRNGLLGQVHRYLNTLGSWSSYRDVSRPEELPRRIGDITAAFFGVAGLEKGLPKLTGLLGAMMALHALEQVTGSLVTFGVRLLGRGDVIERYRGVTIRQSPLTPRTAAALRWLLGSRLLAANGYYFPESGRTWHGQTFTVQVWDVSKTLTHVRSFSLPHREFYFDREVAPRVIIDVVKGDRDPQSIPGFIGSINELEHATSLGYLKRAFFAANWLLIDEGERDDGQPGTADYDVLISDQPLIRGQPPGGRGPSPLFQPAPRPSQPDLGSDVTPPRYPAWPSTATRPPTTLFTRTPPARAYQVTDAARTNGPAPVGSPPPVPAAGAPHERIKDRYHAPDGRQYPLLIRGILTHPITMAKKADAIYYDADTHRWQEIVDEDIRLALAREVEAGQLKVSPDWPALL
ncbi:MAG: hypothetical protein JXM69_17960 [Anaerolineae bacterium]|nr:hypothetical protein [Anaerolineae bacterium]